MDGNEDAVKAPVEKFNMAQLRTDKSKVVEGVWVDYQGGLRFKVARAGNVKADAYRNKLLQQNKFAIQKGDVSFIETVTLQVLAKHILLDWENMQDLDDDDNVIDVPYSYENALRILTEVKDFRDIIERYAEDLSLFQSEKQAEAAKN